MSRRDSRPFVQAIPYGSGGRALLLVIAMLLLYSVPCSAHTFGAVVQTTTVSRSGSKLLFMLDMRLDAGILTFRPDQDGDGSLSLREWNELLQRIRQLTAERFVAQVNGKPAEVVFEDAGDLVVPREGISAGAQVTLEAFVELPPTPDGPNGHYTVVVSDENFALPGPNDRLDWFVNAKTRPDQVRLLDNYWTLRLDVPTKPAAASASEGTATRLSGTQSTPAETWGTQRLLTQIREAEASPLLMAMALGLAFFLGAAHSLSPGHGKSLVAAYLVGSRGRISDAVKLALIVTASHVGGVILLGLLLLASSSFIDIRAIHPWLGVASGLCICAIGYWMLARLALASQHHHHHHPHEHAGHSHDQTSLVSLGLLGGMVPCPTAIVVLLAAVAAGRLAFGLALVFVFSLGLSLVLLLIGVMTVKASRSISALSEKGAFIAKLPVISAGLVMLAGAAIALNALIQAGVLRWQQPW